MRRLVLASSLFALLAAAVVFVACTTDYQMGLEDVKYGDPNALAGQKQPGPSSDTATDGSVSGVTGGPVCLAAPGAALIDGGPCAVSFKTDILGAFGAAGCALAGTCHGGASPPNQPRIEPSDPIMWAEFASFKLQNGKAYINPCSTDPTASTIACNVSKDGGCGSIMPPGLGLPPDVVAKIETWAKCGAPNN